MYTATIKDKAYKIEADKGFTVNGEELQLDLVALKENHFHILKGNTSYNAEIIEVLAEEKTVKVLVNGIIHTVKVQDKLDELLKSMGMDSAASQKAADLKAPMPGLVVDIRVSEGQAVKKGDPLIVLEAMKMENILKAAADGTVKKVSVAKGQAVEKNAVLIMMG